MVTRGGLEPPTPTLSSMSSSLDYNSLHLKNLDIIGFLIRLNVIIQADFGGKAIKSATNLPPIFKGQKSRRKREMSNLRHLPDDTLNRLLMIAKEHTKLALRAMDRKCPANEKQRIIKRIEQLRLERERLLNNKR